ncbi:MAG: hypothetical protein ACI9RV_002294, partial [Glaciecola sp.]
SPWKTSDILIVIMVSMIVGSNLLDLTRAFGLYT